MSLVVDELYLTTTGILASLFGGSKYFVLVTDDAIRFSLGFLSPQKKSDVYDILQNFLVTIERMTTHACSDFPF